MSSTAAAKSNLVDALKKLRLRWAAVREEWNDPASAAFEKEFIEPLGEKVKSAVKGLDQIGDAMAAARRECSQ